ncbi:MAG: hypothetical protein SX243_16730 [Acidobacteriota bacterium]|nr:hypothetical protein [Acidobacteriota bacterium]
MKWSYPILMIALLLSALTGFQILADDGVALDTETAAIQPAIEAQPSSAPASSTVESTVEAPSNVLPMAPLLTATVQLAQGCSGNPPPPGCECGFCCIDCGCWQTRQPVPCLAGP